MPSKLYFKITKDEYHYGFQNVNGLNISQEESNNDLKDSCTSVRLCFTKPKYICKFLNYGIYLREIILPIDNLDYKMIKDPEGDKYGANMIILGKRRDLKNPEMWKYLIESGANIHTDNDE
uniref:Putative ankyrin repeat protein n=1 Tax=Moumouvirus sp. 'Monve' TaxID=1128131 RepID=H2EEF5_9VIRU|nr:putative ankyrin repeat protein [Moumouvirus Monve]